MIAHRAFYKEKRSVFDIDRSLFQPDDDLQNNSYFSVEQTDIHLPINANCSVSECEMQICITM